MSDNDFTREMSSPERNLYLGLQAATYAALHRLDGVDAEALSPAALNTLAEQDAAAALEPHIAMVAGTGIGRLAIGRALAREAVAVARDLWAERMHGVAAGSVRQ